MELQNYEIYRVDSRDNDKDIVAWTEGNGYAKAITEFLNKDSKEKFKDVFEYSFKHISTEQFLKRIYQEECRGMDICTNISFTLSDMLDVDDYHGVIDILNKFDFESFKENGVPLWLLNLSNPVDPLMRPIPVQEKVKELMAVRCIFYDK
jgi:hypothetical protein